MIREFTLSIIFCLTLFSVQAQITNGTVVQNFTVSDINGNQHTLYDYLEEGKTVYIDVFATWCGPCWTYHNTHALKDFYDDYGPDGLDVAMVFGVEGDGGTSVAQILGNGGGTYGDWTEDVPYPIINSAFVAQSILDINFYPTIFKICPIEKKAYVVGQQSANGLYNEMLEDGCTYPFFSMDTHNNIMESCDNSDGVLTFDLDTPFDELGEVTFSTMDLPAGMEASFDNNTITAPGEIQLTVTNMDGYDIGSYPFSIVATSDHRTTYLDVILEIVSPDISETSPLTPIDAAMEISPRPDLSWETADGASTYEIDIATSPLFGNDIVQTLLSYSTTLNLNNPLAEGEIYYWRVRALNACAESDYSEIFVFQVAKTECIAAEAEDVPMNISITDLDVITSTIQITEDVTFDNLELSLTINHTWMGDVKATLIAPDGSDFVLFDRPGFPSSTFGCSSNNIDAVFSMNAENSAAMLENTCSFILPAISGNYQPIDDFSNYAGGSEGEWNLIIEDFYAADGGSLIDWSIKFCSNIDNLDKLTEIHNEPLLVPFEQVGAIENTILNFETLDGTNEDVRYLLTSLPEKGMLYLDGNPAEIYNSFSQSDLDAGLLEYQHNTSEVGEDSFNFNVESTINNGWMPYQTFQISILQNTLSGISELVDPIDCFNGSTGIIEAQITGGHGGLMFSLDGDNFQNEPVFDNLSAGIYSILVQDQFGFELMTNEVILENPTELTLTTSTNDFDITAIGNGGTGIYSYSIDGTNFQNTPDFIAPQNGEYTLYVLDENDCMAQTTVLIWVNTLAVAAAVQNDVSCFEGINGIFEVTALGGTPPLQYSLDEITYQDTPIFENLSAGTYQATVLDAEGFTLISNEITITEPTPIEVSTSTDDFEIFITATGGTGNLAYSLDGENFQSENQFTAPANGNYIVYVKDEHDCVEMINVIIAVNTLVVSAGIQQDISCFDSEDGILEAFVGGGTPPLQFSIDGINFQNESFFENLAPGTYQITVLDAEGFVQITNETTFENPDLLTISANATDFEIEISAMGGTGNLMYSIDGINFQNNSNFIAPQNGNYTLYVQDENACETTTTIEIAVNTLVVAADLENNVSCFGANDGSIVVSVAGGTPPWQYSLDGINYQNIPFFENLVPGVYQATVLDAEGFTLETNEVTILEPSALEISATTDDFEISLEATGGNGNYTYSLDGINYQNEPNFIAPANGNYTLFVMDGNGCLSNIIIQIAVNTMAIDWEVSMITCPEAADGMISINIDGGTPPFTYSINGSTPQTSSIFENLDAGIYEVEVTDAEGFIIQTNEVELTNPPIIIVDTQVLFNQITLMAMGGTGDLMYSLDGINFQSNPVFSDLPNGEYSIIVKDENDCQNEVSAVINIIEGAELTTIPIACADENNGTIEVMEISGGLAPFQYAINHGAWQTSPIFNNLEAGIYAISIIDANGFEWEIEVPLVNPDPISATANIDVTTITIDASGGTGVLQYNIDGGEFQLENVFADIVHGDHEIIVMDENGCTKTISVFINGIFDPTIEITELKLYPNPSSGQIILEFNKPISENTTLEIYDIMGKRIWKQPLDKQSANLGIPLNLESFPNGVYQILIRGEAFLGVGKIEVLR